MNIYLKTYLIASSALTALVIARPVIIRIIQNRKEIAVALMDLVAQAYGDIINLFKRKEKITVSNLDITEKFYHEPSK